MLKVATWNVNSLKVRMQQVLAWLKHTGIDILAMQETKCIDEQFPVAEFEHAGFHVVYSGQKTYNGVAIVSRKPITHIETSVPGFIDPQKRMLAASIGDIRLINLYVPNGSEVDSDKYQYKLNWLANTTSFICHQLTNFPNLLVVGDFNIAPEDKDVHDPVAWQGSVLVSPKERQAFNELISLGLKDSFRVFSPEEQLYSWWDYRAASFRRNRGLRIDHILSSESLQTRCTEVWIDVEPRRADRPSDHAPVCATFDDAL